MNLDSFALNQLDLRQNLWLNTFRDAYRDANTHQKTSLAIKAANEAVAGFSEAFSGKPVEPKKPAELDFGGVTEITDFDYEYDPDLYVSVANWCIVNGLHQLSPERLQQTFNEHCIPTKRGQYWTIKNVQTFKTRYIPYVLKKIENSVHY